LLVIASQPLDRQGLRRPLPEAFAF